MSTKAIICQSSILVSYVILMILNHKNMTLVISSTVIATISCIMCLTTPTADEDDDFIERVLDVMVIAPETITIQIRDEFVNEIEPPVLVQTAVQINHDSFDDPNTPQAIMVATVVPRRCY